MTARTRDSRLWLALGYLLATLLVQVPHRHTAEATDEAAPRCLASCFDARVHLSGHRAPDLEHPRTDCPACQFRAQHPVSEASVARPLLLTVEAAPDYREGPVAAIAIDRPSCRAPPRA
ncbi:MAG: hypothetical protein IRY99_21435 [Isosphaeraceae bacterium]|nr:hypothetical protein [Isosphaeraceae bacterium]